MTIFIPIIEPPKIAVLQDQLLYSRTKIFGLPCGQREQKVNNSYPIMIRKPELVASATGNVDSTPNSRATG